jgi:AhpD family alkylhydroperoxidase
MAADARMEFVEFTKVAPGVSEALYALSKTVGESGLEKALIELIKIRASQVNGCAFCVQFHVNLARKTGVPQAKLDLVAVWRDAGVFSAREMAALEWTEVLSGVTAEGISDEAYAAVREEFAEASLCF